MSSGDRWAWIEVDAAVVTANVARLCAEVAPAEVWAVVKADGYGHGAVVVARAALAGGARGLCVALTQEGRELRRAGIDAPVLVLSEQPEAQLEEVVGLRLASTVYSIEQIEGLARVATAGHPVHIKLDTGMHRVGAPPERAVELARVVAAHGPALRLEGVCTHLAVADEPDDPNTGRQLDRFEAALRALHTAGFDPPLVHTANSAAALLHPRSRRSLVRAGIAVYGLSPGAEVGHLTEGLRPALSLHARVSFVKRVLAGARISYGLRHRFDRPTTVATLPLGYADGVPRRLGAAGGEVLLGGRRCPIVGTVTMDQLMVDAGDLPVAVGDEAVLIGEQAGACICVGEWARRLGTIDYEVVCGLSARLARRPGGAGR